jgi:hypothetical protein
MSKFVIAYVPQVDTVFTVKNVDAVKTVENVNDVQTVHDVRKLPHPYFPLKKYNYQVGGKLHITGMQNPHEVVFVPDVDIEFKGVDMCFTSYNIEDTYDVLIGSKHIIRNSHVKEMAEYRRFETYEEVPEGTPIIIRFYNNSGLEKYLLWDLINLVDSTTMAYPMTLEWNFYWVDSSQVLNEEDTATIVIVQPQYVNADSTIKSYTLTIMDILTETSVATIEYSNGNTTSTYNQNGNLAQVNVMAITNITTYDQSIHITIRNTNTGGTMNGPDRNGYSWSSSQYNCLRSVYRYGILSWLCKSKFIFKGICLWIDCE